jgi:hypothetical protein
MQQVSTIQQRSFDQIQQLLAMMMQAFGPAHARQIDLVRAELLRIHELDLELQELNLHITIDRHVRPEPSGSPARILEAAPLDRAPLRDPQSGVPGSWRDEPIPRRSGLGVSEAAINDPRASSPDASSASLDDGAGGRIWELEQERRGCWQRIMEILTPAAVQN